MGSDCGAGLRGEGQGESQVVRGWPGPSPLPCRRLGLPFWAARRGLHSKAERGAAGPGLRGLAQAGSAEAGASFPRELSRELRVSRGFGPNTGPGGGTGSSVETLLWPRVRPGGGAVGAPRGPHAREVRAVGRRRPRPSLESPRPRLVLVRCAHLPKCIVGKAAAGLSVPTSWTTLPGAKEGSGRGGVSPVTPGGSWGDPLRLCTGFLLEATLGGS